LETLTQGSSLLTKFEQKFIFKTMKNKVLAAIIIFFIAAVFLSYFEQREARAASFLYVSHSPNHPQTVKKPKYDYMSTFLSRNTKPLGLKENTALRKFLKQSSIKWSIRAGERHILN